MAKYEWYIERHFLADGPTADPYNRIFVGETALEACALVVEKSTELDYPGTVNTQPTIDLTDPIAAPYDYYCRAVTPGTDSGYGLGTVYRRLKAGGGNGGAGTDCTRFLLPDEAGFGWTVKKTVFYEELEGGPPRIRSDFVGTTVTVNAAWTVRQKDLARILGILDNSANSPTNVWLFLDGGIQPTQNLCRLIPGTLRVTTIGLTTRISCSLEAEPAAEDYEWPEYE